MQVNQSLHTELVALVKNHLHKPVVFQSGADSEYYGVDDEFVNHNEFGEKIVTKVLDDEKQ